MQKNEVGPLMPYTKKLKWISNLSGRAKLKLLEENIGLDLREQDSAVVLFSSDGTPKRGAAKKKKDHLDSSE